MSEFLLVIPEGWTQLDWQYITNNLSGMTHQQVTEWCNNSIYMDMESILKDNGVIPVDKSITGAKLIDDTYFLVLLG